VVVEVLCETNNPAVVYGDSGLLDLIWERLGKSMSVHPYTRWKRILDALSKQPGVLVAGYTRCGLTGRSVRIFRLPHQRRKAVT